MSNRYVHRQSGSGNARACALLVLGLLFSHASARALELAVGTSAGEAGKTAEATVTLNDAAALASLQFQVNYDNNLLSVVGITNVPGSLGAAFTLDEERHDGFVIVRLFRMDQLVSGTGQVVSVTFAVNAGARPGMQSDLVIAECGLADQFGGDLARFKTVTSKRGSLWVVMSATTDSDGDGLSDYEEQMFNGSPDLDPAKDTDPNVPDTDGDGLSDGYEVAHALNPLVGDGDADPDGDGQSNRQEMLAGTHPGNALDFFHVPDLTRAPGGEMLMRWYALSGRWYSVHSTTNLATPTWETNLYRMSGQDAESSYTNASEGAARFFRFLVEPQP